VAEAGTTHVISLADLRVAETRVEEPKTHSAPARNDVPESVTTVPPETGPESGETESIVDLERTVKDLASEEKSMPLLATSRVVVEGGKSEGGTHSTRCVETNVASTTSEPKRQDRKEEERKFLPLTVMGEVEPDDDEEGYTRFTTGAAKYVRPTAAFATASRSLA
jgi:hypothetical protein